MTKRGVVIAGLNASRVYDEKGKPWIHVPRLDPTLLRTSLLYWDRIDIPDNSLITIKLKGDVNLLEKEGVLTRTTIPFGTETLGAEKSFVVMGEGDKIMAQFSIGGLDTEGILKFANGAPEQALQALVQQKEVLWSFIQNSPTLRAVQSIKSEEKKSVLIEIHEALPVPHKGMPLDKILKFKSKRQSELLALREEIDAMYQQIVNSEDLNHAKHASFTRIEKALIDLDKIAKESWGTKAKRSIKLEANLARMASAAALGVAVGAPLYLTPVIVLCTYPTVDLKNLVKTDLPDSFTPFKYFLDAHKEIGVPLTATGMSPLSQG